MPDEPKLTHLQKSRIRMEVVIPIIRALENEIGVERAHQIVREALDTKARKEVSQILGGKRVEKMPFNSVGMDAVYSSALQYEVLREDDEAFDFNVTGCGYKRMMEEMDAVDLGGLLFCNGDFASADEWGVDLERTQTCMQGASHCNFRYRLRSRDGNRDSNRQS